VRIAIVIFQYWPDRGGVENYCRLLVNALLERGHTVDIFCARRRSVGDIEGRVTFHHVPIIPGDKAVRALSFAYNAARAVRNGGYDIVQSLARSIRQDVYRMGGGLHKMFLRESMRGKSRAAVTVKMLRPYHWVAMHIEKRVFTEHLYRHVVCNSGMVKREVVDLFNVDPADVSVIHNGVDLDKFNPANRDKYRDAVRRELGIGPDDRVALVVATSFSRKGLGQTVEALGRMNRRDRFRLLVIGGDNPAPYKRRAVQTGVDVHFLGRQTAVERFYAASDVFVLPTAYDPFANVTLEAMASGIPVITTLQNGASEIVDGGREGYVVDNQTDVDGIHRALEKLGDPAVCSEMSVHARAKAERFSHRHNADQVIALYETLLCN